MAGIIRKKPTPSAPVESGTNSNVSDDWEDAPSEITRKIVHMDIIGEEGTGRTSLALSAPGPIAFINADEKIQGIVQPHVQAGKKIKVASFGFVASGSPEEVAASANPVWSKVKNWHRDSLSFARSTVVDTGTETWELLRLARFGTLKPEGRMDALYGPVNAEYRTLIKQFRMQDRTNLITIHQVKEKYKEGVKDGRKFSVATGQMVRAGFKEMGYLADIVVRTGKDITTNTFTARIEKGWYNAQVEGMVLENEDIRFSYILSLITGLDEEEFQ